MQCLTGGGRRGLWHQFKTYTPIVTAVINAGAVIQKHALETMSLITPCAIVHGREAELVFITTVCERTYKNVFELSSLAKGVETKSGKYRISFRERMLSSEKKIE